MSKPTNPNRHAPPRRPPETIRPTIVPFSGMPRRTGRMANDNRLPPAQLVRYVLGGLIVVALIAGIVWLSGGDLPR